MKHNILFITYYFNPIKAPGSIRNSKLAKYLFLQGHNIYIQTTSNRYLFPREDILKEYSRRIAQKYVLTFDYQTIKCLLLKLNQYFKQKIIEFNPFKKESQMFLLKIFNLFPFNVLIGEGGGLYIIHNVINAIFRIKRYDIHIIYTSFSPFSDIFIGYILKLIFPSLKWVADFRDLHLQGSKNNLLLKITDRVDKLILSRADYITTVSYGLAEILKEYNSNIKVLRNGFDPDDLPVQANINNIKKFSFLYAGALYGIKRDPSILFEVLNDLIMTGNIKKKILN